MKIFEIDATTNPHLGVLQKLLAQVIGEEGAKMITPTRMSHDLVIKCLQEGKLVGIEEDMKISKTIFYHYYTDDIKEVIIQISDSKFALFSDVD